MNPEALGQLTAYVMMFAAVGYGIVKMLFGGGGVKDPSPQEETESGPGRLLKLGCTTAVVVVVGFFAFAVVFGP